MKHSRLSRKIDFGKIWFGTPCSDEYWQRVNEIFDRLEPFVKAKTRWENSDLDKEKMVYEPLLSAFTEEIQRIIHANPTNATYNLIKYLYGDFCYYKQIGKGSGAKRKVKVFYFDLAGEHRDLVPTRIESICRKNKNKVVVNFDKGWIISFRIHNASSVIENSMKFDVQAILMPDSFLLYED